MLKKEGEIVVLNVLNLTNQKLRSHAVKSAQYISCTTLTHIVLHTLRRLETDIWRLQNLKKRHFADARKILRVTFLSCNITFLFKKDGTSSFQFLKINSSWALIEVLHCSTFTSPIYSQFQDKFAGLKPPKFIRNLGSSLCERTYPIVDLLTTQNKSFLGGMWNTLIKVILEEFIFRGILQEGLLRRLPKLALQISGLASPEIIDSLMIRTLRIGITAIVFGLTHAHFKKPPEVIRCIIHGISYGYMNEKMGLFSGGLPHFDHNLYLYIGGQRINS